MNLRRWIAALAVLALFTAVAGAQVTANQVTCTASAATTPNVRAEGYSERVGDVLLTCINGLPLTTGNVADRITLTVTYTAPIMNQTDGLATPNSDIMLTIDEPNSLSNAAANELGIGGYGPNANIIGVCTVAAQAAANLSATTNQLSTCPAFSYLAGINPAQYYATSATGLTGGANAINVYQGAISNTAGTAVTFSNVPFVPPVVNTAGQGTLVSRVYRITGVRVNAVGQSTISATVGKVVVNSNDVSTFSAVVNPQVTVGTVASSLSTSVVPSPLSVCIQTTLVPSTTSVTLPASASYLKFTEAFGTAFKTRVVSITPGDTAYGVGTDLQAATQPVNGTYVGGTYSNVGAESGVLIPIGGTSTVIAGLATTGTRLQATFANLDTTGSITYYLSLNNVVDFNDPPTGKALPGNAGDTTAAPFAVLQTQSGGQIAAYSASASSLVAGSNKTVPVVQLSITKGAAEAVWEITNTDLNVDTYTFAVYAVYNANALSPTPTNLATVALGYAPTDGTPTGTPVGVTVTSIPRFTGEAAAQTLLNLLPCRTTLLFPYLTSTQVSTGTPPAGQANSWQTGVAIENTGADPLQTAGGTGTCTLNFYGAGAPPAVQTPSIAPGGEYAFLVSDPGNTGVAVTNWVGYGFAVCNFNYGHGFVFIEDNTRSMAMGYLAEVLNQQTSSVPRGQFTLGEGNDN